MKKYVSKGESLQLTAPTGGVVTDTVYKIGNIICIAEHSAVEGDPFTALTEGLVDYLAEGAGSGQAWAEGDTVYWDNTAHQFTKTASGNTKAGSAVAVKATADVLGRLKLGPRQL